MLLPSPTWTDLTQPGLRSARQSVADGSIILTVTPATSNIGTVYYNVYFGETQIPAFPQLTTAALPITVPDTLAGGDWKFAVTASVGGLTPDFDFLPEVSGPLRSVAGPTELAAAFLESDTTIQLSDASGYPSDGYLLIGDEVIFYQDLFANSANVTARSPYGGTPVDHSAGDAVELWRGSEAFGSTVGSIKSCGLELPHWADISRVGLELVEELGDGGTVELTWPRAVAPVGFSGIRYNIYKSSDLHSLYSIDPIATTANQEAMLTQISPRAAVYLGVRATYFVSSYTNDGMTELSDGVYAWPAATALTGDVLVGQTGTVEVGSTAGYPDAGLLKVGSEILSYSSLTPNAFVINKRDVFSLGWVQDFATGTGVSLFRGVEDGINIFWRLNTSWDASGVQALPLEPGDGYWGFQYLQNPDGYRDIPVAESNEDHSIVIEDAENAQPFDYCGLRSTDQSQLLGGDFCQPATLTGGGGGTYHGNSGLGQAGGINVFEGNLDRQETLLGITGSPFILLRRKWTGQTCRRLSHRNEHPFARCELCYGTTFEGGYDRYIHGRLLRPAEANPNGMIMVRVSPYSDDLVLTEDRGLSTEKTDMEGWLPAVPTVRPRDILIRYSFDYETKIYTEEFRYEVIRVDRNNLILGKDGSQKISFRRLNPTEEIYKYPVFII